jgi:hypothetical protein
LRSELTAENLTTSNSSNVFSARDMRFDCELDAKLIFLGAEIPIRIVNISERGLAFNKAAIIDLPIGTEVMIWSKKLGALYCVLKWGANSRFGAEMKSNSARSVKLQLLLKSLIEEHEK